MTPARQIEDEGSLLSGCAPLRGPVGTVKAPLFRTYIMGSLVQDLAISNKPQEQA
ncbi:MAG: hypothetical protein ACOYKZ_01360 [Chlamydiia bacterium]